MAIKKDHSKILGIDFDPKGDMQVDVKPDGDCSVKYKGTNMDYDSYVDELEERVPTSGQNQPTVNVAQENVRSETNQRNFLNDQSQGKLAKEASDKD